MNDGDVKMELYRNNRVAWTSIGSKHSEARSIDWMILTVVQWKYLIFYQRHTKNYFTEQMIRETFWKKNKKHVASTQAKENKTQSEYHKSCIRNFECFCTIFYLHGIIVLGKLLFVFCLKSYYGFIVQPEFGIRTIDRPTIHHVTAKSFIFRNAAYFSWSSCLCNIYLEKQCFNMISNA